MKHDGISTGLFQDEEDGYNLDEEETLEEDTKYKLKLPNSSPEEDSGDDFDLGGDEDLDLGGEGEEDLDLDLGGEEGDEEGGDESSDKPFDDEPFDAGVEASEEDDPEKYIQQLSGKLGQSMRDYTEEMGEPDFDLEKFAINSVISASHSAEMDEEDQDDIIEKVKSSGRGEVDDEPSDEEGEEDLDLGDEGDDDLDLGGDEEGEEDLDLGGEEGLEENFDDIERGGEIRSLHFHKITSELDKAKTVEELNAAVDFVHNNFKLDKNEIIALSNFHDIKMRELGGDMGDLDTASSLGESKNPCWKGYEQVGMKEKDGKEVPNCVPIKENLQEAEYQGKTVELNQPSRGDVKKFKVYVKNDKGNVVKVNFGDKNMEIKRDDPERRKSFRARHKCDSPGPKWKARYWSCKMWSKKSVSDMLKESEKTSIFVNKLKEMAEPAEPQVEPKRKEKEVERPTRRQKTFNPSKKPNPNPKFGNKELIVGDEE